MNRQPIRRQRKPSEEGYMLLAVIFMLALLIISLSIALPKIAKEIQRDRELETMQRGKQYIRAIKMYYKKFGSYPPNVDVLTKPLGVSNLRFLRKKYKDPTTGKEEWKAIQLGQNKAPTAMGFFGQPLMGTTTGGMVANGGNPITGAQTLGNPIGGIGGNTTDPSTGQPTDPATGTPTDPNNPASTAGATGTPGLSGQTFGGAGIIGFSPTSPKQSILVYKKKNHYNEWEFVYDPITDRMSQPGGGGTGAQPLQPGAPGAPLAPVTPVAPTPTPQDPLPNPQQ